MKENTFLLNILLVAAVGLALLACVVIKAFLPTVCLPRLDLPAMTALSLLALLAEHYLAPGAKRVWVPVLLLGCVTFGLLPVAAGLAGADRAGVLALAGGAVFGAVTWLFDQAAQRIGSGPAAKAAPVLTALGLFLASQCFTGILL